jgi:hypothetical protein
MLVDWELVRKYGDRRRTSEIAAEYGDPQSLSALLKLTITSFTEEHFLCNKVWDTVGLLGITITVKHIQYLFTFNRYSASCTVVQCKLFVL